MPKDPRNDLVTSVRRGKVNELKDSINAFTKSYPLSPWDGYVLLLEALHNDQIEIAKYLLTEVTDFVRDSRPGIQVECNSLLFSALFVLAVVNCDNPEIIEILVTKNPRARETLLFAAIQHNRMDIVKMLMNDQSDIHHFPKGDLTPIQFAMQVNKILTNGTLLRRRIHVSRTNGPKLMSDKSTSTALLNIVGRLLTTAPIFTGRFGKRYYMDYSRCTDYNPLHVAIRTGKSNVVKLLLERGGNVDDDNNDGQTAFQLALTRRHALSKEKDRAVILAYVIVCSLNIDDKKNRTALLDAVDTTKDDYVDVLSDFSRGRTYITRAISDIIYHNRSTNIKVLRSLILHAAVEKGYANIVKQLFELSNERKKFYNSLTVEGFTLLHTAVTSQRLEIVELLVNYGADVMAKDMFKKTPMYYAIENGDLSVTSRLVDFGAVISNTPLLLNMAVWVASMELVKFFLQFNGTSIDVNAKDEDGNTPLHSIALNRVTENDKMSIAIYQDTPESTTMKAEIAKLLISQGADIEARNNKQQTPLHAVAKKGYVEVVEVLMKNNADIFTTDYKGATPLHLSTWHSSPTIARMFIREKADVNARRKDGSLVLRDAIVGGSERVLSLLLRHGADINAVCKCGNTLFECHNLNHYRRVRRLGFGRWLRISDVIKRHIIKLKAAGLYVTEGNLRALKDIPEELKSFGDHCVREIGRMKHARISQNVSFYDIAVDDFHDVAIYARFTSVMNAIDEIDWKEKFPIYYEWIEENLKRALERERLLVPSVNCLEFLMGAGIPDVLTMDVLRYLDNSDLGNLIIAGDYEIRRAADERREKMMNKRRSDERSMSKMGHGVVARLGGCPRCDVFAEPNLMDIVATRRDYHEGRNSMVDNSMGPTPAKLHRRFSFDVAMENKNCSFCSNNEKSSRRTRASSFNL